ncbi:hypothetical protein [Maridesulfovibrio hydrothermalis]|uniref:Uncharacterized protein n=1 Tax=Maridesulfovibrio hydrothermalis AM13 = DSM 14728 TaxID=1121451 RepID=L0R810_9BACT|nr:hypothetical protein [Maridesulfovibrio hydrothermalis]CCO22878.1 conserved membrane protein of unknown function [Maridesulfovibrio hydrothermalis AM13 = DSM 14728]
MSGIGVNEIFLLILLIGATLFPVWLGFRLRRTKPGLLWIGMLLSVLFGPVGQVYVKGWLPWVLILLGVMIGAQQLLPANIAMLLMLVSSPLVMLFRMRK